jgi:hypothetical protein
MEDLQECQQTFTNFSSTILQEGNYLILEPPAMLEIFKFHSCPLSMPDLNL